MVTFRLINDFRYVIWYRIYCQIYSFGDIYKKVFPYIVNYYQKTNNPSGPLICL